MTTFSEQVRAYLARFYAIFDAMVLDMTGAALTDSISHNFIVQMIPHHRAAIRMSGNLLQYTGDGALQRLAGDIIREQTQGIADMRAILPGCSARVNACRDLMLYQRRTEDILETMFRDMEQAGESACIDVDFLREMIPHHQGAVSMSENALRYPICPDLEPILRRIIRSQEREIREMRCLLHQRT